VVVATTAFIALARHAAASFGLPDARVAVIEHPLGTIAPGDVAKRADAAVEETVALLTR
jgi:hypothetical protein